MATPVEDLPALPDGLEAMLAAERELPPVPPGLEERLWARLGRALGWGAGGAGGAALAVWLLKLVLVVGAAVGALAVGWVAVRGRGADRPEAGPSEKRTAVRLDAARGPAVAAVLPSWFGAPDRPDVAIAGRVVGADGGAVAGARVVLTSNVTRAGLVEADEVTSDATGAFAFGAHRAATYDVTAASAGQGEGYVRVDTLDPTARPRPDALVVALPGCAHALFGTVRDASGGVIAGAQVSRARGAYGDVSPIGLGAITDEQGAYELCTPPGALTAIARADGYGTMTVLDTVIGRRRRDLELVPAATVIGRVVRAGDDAPVADAVVWLRPAGFPPRVRATPDVAASGADGRFRFVGIAPGRHYVTAAIVGAASVSAPVVVDPGRESADVVLRLEARNVEVAGRVVDDGRPVPGARVTARSGAAWVTAPPADADGRFLLHLAAPQTIAFSVEDYDVVAPLEYRAEPGGPAVTIELSARGVIRGVVRRGGRAIAGAEVMAISPAQEGRATVVSDAVGAFELRGRVAGRHSLVAQSFDALAFSSKPIDVELASREVREGVVLELDGGASIAGTVVDQDDAALADVAVHWADPVTGDLCDARTAADGAFTCVMLSGGGDYTPLVRLDDGSAIRLPAATPGGLAPVHVADGNARVTGVTLRVRAARAAIRGRVVDRAGAPYADVSVRAIEASTAYTPATAPWLGVRTTVTDGDGRFALPAWQDARYTLHARAPGGAEASLADVVAGGPEPVLRLGRPGRIVGSVLGFAERPAIMVRPIGGPSDVERANVDGARFVVDGLTAGRYAILVTAGAQAAAQVVEVHDGADATVELRPRATTRLEVRVVDFLGGGPIAGARCTIAPDVEGAGVAWWGTEAPLTDGDGRFAADAPTGAIAVTCLPREGRHSGGAARVTAAAGEASVRVAIPVVVSPTSDVGGNGIGARIGFATAPVAGNLLTIVELRPGGAGEKAGLRVGDVITAVDGRDVTPLTDGGLLRLLGLHAVGDVARVAVRRGAVARTIAVTVEGPWWP